MQRLVLVDGNALLHRAFHATPPLTTQKGELINAVFGFTSMLLRAISDLKPDFIIVTWDEKGPTFRHQAYTQYKATRGPADDGLTSQYKRVHQLVESLNIPEFSLAGYEADDLIGTLARQAVEGDKKLEVIVITGDRDIMQIIDKNIKILMPKKTLADVGMYGIDEFVDKFGFAPKYLVDYKALAGDVSDNIPGVPGIGGVTATKLINQFLTVEEIYKPENLKTLPERTQKLLAEGAESAAISKTLATLDLNAPIKIDILKCKVHDYDHQKALDLFEELGFKSLMSKLPGGESSDEAVRGPAAAVSHESILTDVAGDSQEPFSASPLTATSLTSQNQQTIDLDLAVTKVLEKMTKTGVLIDTKFLEKFGDSIKKRIKKLEEEIYSTVGHEFNINSPKQLADILFDELHLPVIKKTKTGRSTDEGSLKELQLHHLLVPLILEYRQLFKLISTYVDALPKYLGPDKRVHSTFNVEGAATGRLSSTNPNLQNIPIKGDLGLEIRKAFIAPKGKVLLAADYSQIELRILASVSDDPNLKKAFQDGLDIHTATASKIFKVGLGEVTKLQRMIGKTMNFATLYGQGAHALSRQLGVDYQTARTYIQEYFDQFPKVKEWMIKVLEQGYKDGFVETLWGRKRYIPELVSNEKRLRAFGERAAVNHPIQGTSADMIKKAMVEIGKSSVFRSQSSDKKSDSQKTDGCRLILQIHDELLFECSPKEVEKVAKVVKEKMENALKLEVPVIVDLKVGPNWGEMTKLNI